MKPQLQFDFIVDKENKSIRIQRELDAELSMVWDAYTKPELLDQWWAPKPWKARTKTMDFREGGHWHYAMCGPAGEEHWGLMRFNKIQVHKLYSGIDCFTDSEATVNTELPQAKWEVAFTAKAGRTLVDYLSTYSDLAQLETIIQMGFKEGMTIALEGLDEVLLLLKTK